MSSYKNTFITNAYSKKFSKIRSLMHKIFHCHKYTETQKPQRTHAVIYGSSVEWISNCTQAIHSSSFHFPEFAKIFLVMREKTPAFKYLERLKAIRVAGELKKVYDHSEICPALSIWKTKMLTRLTSSLRTSIKTSTFQVWAWLPSLLSLPSLQIPLPGAEIDCKSNTLNQTLVKHKAVSTPTGYRTPCTRKVQTEIQTSNDISLTLWGSFIHESITDIYSRTVRSTSTE